MRPSAGPGVMGRKTQFVLSIVSAAEAAALASATQDDKNNLLPRKSSSMNLGTKSLIMTICGNASIPATGLQQESFAVAQNYQFPQWADDRVQKKYGGEEGK